jgi:prepilin-type N-terminal cleavage/methylation domain-containing protein
MRRGFTLLEMMIATAVFVIGFVSVYSLFLAGSRYRRQADVVLASAMAAEELITTLRLRAGTEPDSLSERSYNGDGLATVDSPDGDQLAGDGGVPFFSYTERPTLYYRFVEARELDHLIDADGSLPRRSFFIRLQLLDIGAHPSDQLSLAEVARYLRINVGDVDRQPRDAAELEAFLEWEEPQQQLWMLRNRDLLHQWDVIIARRDPPFAG